MLLDIGAESRFVVLRNEEVVFVILKWKLKKETPSYRQTLRDTVPF